MAYPPSDQPGAGGASELRRSVDDATGRIREIVDAAERVADQIRSDAEAEARSYLAARKREADNLAEDRSQALDQLTRTLADTAEQFKHQAERMLADLDQAIVAARAGLYTHRTEAPAPEEARTQHAPEPLDNMAPLPKLDFDLRPLRSEPEPQPAPARDPDPFEYERRPEAAPEPLLREPLLGRSEPAPSAVVSAYPGTEAARPAGDSDQTSEALLRATQLAVTGKGREEIAAVLRTDFPSVAAEPLLDEILG